MNKQELDTQITGLKKKQRKEIELILNEAGSKAFDQAVTDGKTSDEATLIAEEAAVKAGEEYLAKLSVPDPLEGKDEPIPGPEIVQKVNWGGHTTLQLEPHFRGFAELLKKEFPQDTELRVLSFTAASPEDRKDGKLYRVSVTGNVSGIKKIII